MRTCAALCLGQPVMLSITAIAPEDCSSSRRDPIVASFQQGKYTDQELSWLLPYSQCAWETSQQPLQRIKSKSESPQAAELSVASRGRCYIKKGSYSSGSQVLWESDTCPTRLDHRKSTGVQQPRPETRQALKLPWVFFL